MQFSVCGTYSLNQSIIDVWIMLFFGVLGFFMRRYGFSVVPVIIGLILGELVEGTLRQSLVIFDGNWLMFFTRPIALTFFILSLIALAFPLIRSRKIKKIMIKYDLNDRVAVVTGGAQGFGLAITERFIEAGAKVIIWDIDENAAKEAIDKVKSENLSHQVVDVTNFEIVNKNLGEVDKKYGKIDIFVNNAGIAGMNTTVAEYPLDEWKK
ncbi:MAG: hypothetical protein CM1200mP13_05190 [Candidatus Pelagibacterales bacterium]|nr:MAG: hypothetical protein CM1200mP13_05190 [Pelagibacterales bacterium]